jgi:uncharacterized protein YbcI
VIGAIRIDWIPVSFTRLLITGAKVVSLHHDISTITGEEVVVFTLADSPIFRGIKKR